MNMIIPCADTQMARIAINGTICRKSFAKIKLSELEEQKDQDKKQTDQDQWERSLLEPVEQ